MTNKLTNIFEGQKENLKYYLISRRSRLIICAGMPRSGSTWLFNAVRLLLKRSHEQVYGAWIEDFNFWKFMREGKRGSALVLKVHSKNSVLEKHSDTVLYSIRDLRDAIPSSMRMWKWDIERAMKSYKNQIAVNFPAWSAASSYTMRYEEMLKSPEKILHDLSLALNVKNYNRAAILNALKEMNYYSTENRNDVHNLDNLYHKGHITREPGAEKSDETRTRYAKLVETEFSDWLKENNYL